MPGNRRGRFNIEEAINGTPPPARRVVDRVRDLIINRTEEPTRPDEPVEDRLPPLPPLEVFDDIWDIIIAPPPAPNRGRFLDDYENWLRTRQELDQVTTLTQRAEQTIAGGANIAFEVTDNGRRLDEPPRFRITHEDTIYHWGTDSGSTFSTKSMKKYEMIDKNGKVKTITGEKHLAIECFPYDGDYYHKSHKDIAECYFCKELNFKNKMLKVNSTFKIIDGKIEQDFVYIYKNFIDKTTPCYSVKYNKEFNIVDIDGIDGWECKEDIGSSMIVDMDYKEMPIDKVTQYEVFKNYWNNKDLDKKSRIHLGMTSPTYLITEGLKYTFGVELEVSRGFIPKWMAARGLNVLCIRDGSVDGGAGNGGPEYVTGVLKGDTGINHLQLICQTLSKRTTVNHTCGVHLHLGNIDFTPKFLVNSYRLALILENEIFSTLPLSRRKNRYCKKLKKFKFRPAIGDTKQNLIEIEEDYNTLFAHMAVEKATNPTFQYNKDTQHPLGAKCSYNHETPRYCWLNYVPAVFNTRGDSNQKSIEIRNMNGSTNFTKIKNWLLFFMAFMAFADKYPELINENTTMDDVLNKMLPKKAKVLSLYFNSRKTLFEGDNESKEYTEKVLVESKTIKELM